MNLLCQDKDCEYYRKKLVYVKIDGEYRTICPNDILTQSDYNLKFVKYESEANK